MNSRTPSPFEELQTVEALAAHFGRDVAWSVALLTSAGVPVHSGVFSMRALRAAMEGERSRDVANRARESDANVTPDEHKAETVLRVALARVGLEMFEQTHNRGLVGLLRPVGDSTSEIYFAPVPIDTMEPEHPLSYSLLHPDEFVRFASDERRSFRMFTCARMHAGLAHFTVARSRIDTFDFGFFVEIEDARVWIVPSSDMAAFVAGAGPLTHGRMDKSGRSLRFAFPRRASTYVLENRIWSVPRPKED